MKTVYHIGGLIALIVLGAFSAEAQSRMFGGSVFGNQHATLVVRADGSCTLTNESTQNRASLEMQVTMWERYSKRLEGDESGNEDEAAAPPPPSKAVKTPLTDKDIESKIRAMYDHRSEYDDESSEVKIDSIQVATNTVRIVTTRSFATLKDLISENPYSWSPMILMLSNARAEIDTNHNFRLTLSNGGKEVEMYKKMLGRQLKSEKVDLEWKLVLPGKILGSTLSNVQDNATWFRVNSEKPESLESATKLIGTPMVISAEAGGLKLDEPLESKSLARRSGGRRAATANLPITDAGPGFLAEPVRLSISTAYVFPDASKYHSGRLVPSMFGMNSTGTVVSVKLFPPKGREIKSISGLRVKSAKDDQGRAIPVPAGARDENADASEGMSYSFDGGESTTGHSADLRLGLPAPDAKAIDELQAEAVALTFGGWKELLLTNVQADATKEIDLGEVLPGAKLIVKKITSQRMQRSVQAALTGPREVDQLEAKIKLSSPRSGGSNISERRSKTVGNKTTREVTIQSYEFENSGSSKETPLVLVIRYPQDVKRERVQFKLTALDLL
jgi:hypothetical protein